MRHPGPRSARSACLAAVVLTVALAMPAGVAAHAELESASPADGATVPSPFDGPITMTFSAALAEGSKADLVAADGSVVASATVDGPGATMTIALGAPLAPGSYEVRWVSVGDDGDLERDTFSFTVEAPAATPPPASTPPTAEPTPAPSATPESTVVASSSSVASPDATPDASATAGSGDVLLPIIVGVLVVVAGGVYLLSRRRSGVTR